MIINNLVLKSKCETYEGIEGIILKENMRSFLIITEENKVLSNIFFHRQNTAIFQKKYVIYLKITYYLVTYLIFLIFIIINFILFKN